MAAGPVGSDSRAIHAACIASTAPTATALPATRRPDGRVFEPYPRDYRARVQVQIDPVGQRPAHDDLKDRAEGIPARRCLRSLLPDIEVEALVDYVKYLSIRGEASGPC
jgi:hypothetical protein